MNKRYTKNSLYEAVLSMDMDTYNKNKGTFNDDDKIKIDNNVEKGSTMSLNEDDEDISETNKEVEK